MLLSAWFYQMGGFKIQSHSAWGFLSSPIIRWDTTNGLSIICLAIGQKQQQYVLIEDNLYIVRGFSSMC